jgi:thiamine-phosphate diphosphorylase
MHVTANDFCLYAVTDSQWLKGKSLSSQVRDAILGGVTFVQLREKHLSDAAFIDLAQEIKAVTDIYNIPLVINDDVNIALQVKAQGVHLGQNDLSIQDARQLLGPDKTIGISVHTVAEAIEAQAHGADYLGVGAVFQTGTKEDTAIISLDQLKAITAAVQIPVVAIGGIQLNRIAFLEGSGISGIAVVSALFAHEDIKKAAVDLKKTVTGIILNSFEKGAP